MKKTPNHPENYSINAKFSNSQIFLDHGKRFLCKITFSSKPPPNKQTHTNTNAHTYTHTEIYWRAKHILPKDIPSFVVLIMVVVSIFILINNF